MLSIRNTICCPGCAGILRVSAQVVSDGRVYQYYLCPRCADAVRFDPEAQAWRLQGTGAPQIPETVRFLAALAVDDWRERSTRREPVVKVKAPAALAAKGGPPAGTKVVTTAAPARLPEKERPAVRTTVVKT